MKTKLIVCLGMLCMLWNFPLDAQHKMVKLSNFDPAIHRLYGNTEVNQRRWAYANIWGDEICGREFAFIGVPGWDPAHPRKGVSIVEVTDPLNIKEVAFIQCPESDQLDFVTYTNVATGSTYLYIVGEGMNTGMRIVDITGITNTVPSTVLLQSAYLTGSYDVQYGAHAHNIQLDKVNHKLLVCGTHGWFNGGFTMFMFDLDPTTQFPNAPMQPTLIGVEIVAQNGPNYVHDVYFDDNKLYTASGDLTSVHGNLGIYDNQAGPFVSQLSYTTYPTDQSTGLPIVHYIHDVYASADHTKLVTSDEHILGEAIFWDISNPATPVETDRYSGHTTGPNSWDTVAQHNHVIKGNDRCYVAHYSNGLWVLDISDPYDVKEIAYYDTYLQHNYGNYNTYLQEFIYPYGTGYYGTWGVFADLPSGNILVCDMNNGLYVLNDCVKPALQGGNNIVLGSASYSNMVYGKAATTNLTVDPAGGNYTVGTDGNVTLIAGSKITIKPGFHAQADGKFHAQIGSMCQNCSDCPLGPTEDPDKSKTDKVVPPPAGIATLTCFPNPASNLLNIKITLPEPGTTSLVIHDQVGRTVRTVSENVFSGSGVTQHSIDIAALPAGVYTIKLSAASGVQTVRFSKLQ